ncbi:phage tail domain-containing protein [Paenibacillus peoriae]|uniref:phage tail domain-containing protein n=1 Tax=Paenibacillus peoriae TaxID=59893 RepID=UPI0032AFF5CF
MIDEMIWLGGKSNAELGFIVLSTSKRPGLPNTVDRTLSIPGRNGLWNYGADHAERQFTYECAFIAKDYIELQQRVMTLAAHLVDSYGKPRELELKQRERPGQAFVVQYAGNFDVERIMGVGKFSLPLVAFDPFASGQERIYETIITKSPENVQIYSGGNIRAYPYIVLTNIGTTTLRSFRIANEYQVE